MASGIVLFTAPIGHLAAFASILLYYNYKHVKDAMQNRIKDGNLVTLSGVAHPDEDSRESPINSEEAIFYDYEVKNLNQRSGNTTLHQDSYKPDNFILDTGSRRVLVDMSSNIQSDLDIQNYNVGSILGGDGNLEELEYDEEVLDEYIKNGKGDTIKYKAIHDGDEITATGRIKIPDFEDSKLKPAPQKLPKFLGKIGVNVSETVILSDGDMDKYAKKNIKWLVLSTLVFILCMIASIYAIFPSLVTRLVF